MLNVYSDKPTQEKQVVYNKRGHCLRKLWSWNANSICEDSETGLLRVLLLGHAFNWDSISTFGTVEGSRCTPLTFDYLGNFREGLACVRPENQKFGYVDRGMNVVIPFIYDYAEDFHEGKARVMRDGRKLMIDKQGRELFTIDDICANIGLFSEGLCKVSIIPPKHMKPVYYSEYDDTVGNWGFINESGKIVIEPQYIYADDFENGIAIVCKGELQKDASGGYWAKTALWGGIDRDGKEVIPFIFDEIKYFYDTPGIYMAHIGGWKEGNWGVIDDRGNWLVEPIFDEIDYEYVDGLFTFYTGEIASNGESFVGVYDLNAQKVLLEPRFTDISLYKDGTIAATFFDPNLGREVEMLLDRKGKELFPSVYSSIHLWSYPYEVYIRDENGCRHGLIDKNGNTVLPCKYAVAWNGFLREQKRIIFEQGDKVGLMDFKDKVLAPAVYHEIHGIDDPLLTIRKGDKSNYSEGLMDFNGNIILPPRCKRIRWLKDKTHVICEYHNNFCELYVYTRAKKQWFWNRKA